MAGHAKNIFIIELVQRVRKLPAPARSKNNRLSNRRGDEPEKRNFCSQS
jgi:hypothetical protein